MEEDVDDDITYTDKQIDNILDDTIIALTQLKDLGDWVGKLPRDEWLRIVSKFRVKHDLVSELIIGGRLC